MCTVQWVLVHNQGAQPIDPLPPLPCYYLIPSAGCAAICYSMSLPGLTSGVVCGGATAVSTTVQTFEFRGTLIFAQADLNFFMQKFCAYSQNSEKLIYFCDVFCKFHFLRSYWPKNYLFFCVFFCASCATKFFRTNDYALHEWMLLKALWYDDAACPWSQGPNF